MREVERQSPARRGRDELGPRSTTTMALDDDDDDEGGGGGLQEGNGPFHAGVYLGKWASSMMSEGR